MHHRCLATLLACVCLAGVSGSVKAETILNYAPNPASPLLAELTWNGTTLSEGPGAVSSGDGNLGTSATAAAPGLLISVPFLITGVPGSTVGPSGTTFFDSTLDLTSGFTAPIGVAGWAANFSGFVIQPLGAGAFEIRSSNVTGGNKLLLSATTDDATISGLNGTGAASVLSATVTYTGGLIYNAMVAAGYDIVGELSWSLIDVSPSLAINTSTHHLRSFSANATGLLSSQFVAPEPSSLAVLMLVGAGVLLRRR
jgi:hypothetical protein